MKTASFSSGDLVVYVDADEIRWGPWEVVDMTDERVTVRVEAGFVYEVEPVRRDRLRKVTNQRWEWDNRP